MKAIHMPVFSAAQREIQWLFRVNYSFLHNSAMTVHNDCIFCKIARGEIPAQKVYEDDDVLAFLDINPAAPVHVLLIPKKHISSLANVEEADAALLGKMMTLVPKLAKKQKANDGFRLIVNAGRIGNQEVPHLHLHIISGPEPLGRMLAN